MPALPRKTISFYFFHYFPLILVLGTGFGITLSVFNMIAGIDREREGNLFRVKARERIYAIRQALEGAVENIYSLRIFLESSERVDTDDFHWFTKQTMESSEAMSRLGWISRERRNEDQPGLPPPPRTVGSSPLLKTTTKIAYPIRQIEPLRLNQKFIGMDLGSIPFYRRLLDLCSRKGEMLIHFRKAVDDPLLSRADFLVMSPVYEKGKGFLPVRENQFYLKGFVFGQYRFPELVHHALAFFETLKIDFYFLLDTGDLTSKVLYMYPAGSGSPHRVGDLGARDVLNLKGQQLETTTLKIGGRRIVIVALATEKPDLGRIHWILFTGVVGTLLVTLLLHVLLTRTEYAQQMVELRTDELKAKTDEAVRAYLKLKPEIEERKEKERELKDAIAQLERTNAELDKFNRLMVGRELRIVELKRKIRSLESELEARPFDR